PACRPPAETRSAGEVCATVRQTVHGCGNEKVLDRLTSQTGELVARGPAPECFGESRDLQFRFRFRLAIRRTLAACTDRPVKQPLAAGRDELQACVLGARRLTEEGHVLRVAAEYGDVVAHPLERGLLIEQPLVARRRAFRLETGVREETERAQA